MLISAIGSTCALWGTRAAEDDYKSSIFPQCLAVRRRCEIKLSRLLNPYPMQPASIDRPAIRVLLAGAERSLVEGPHPERARRDAQSLLLHVLRRDEPAVNLAWLIAHQEKILSPSESAAFQSLLNRRLAGEPIQYITGVVEFFGLGFHVDHDVLIPRPETEHLVEKALVLAANLARPRIVDVGTGSGAIAVALARHLPNAYVFATDISAPALSVARENAESNGVANGVRFFEGDLLAPVAGEKFDIVVSNPPYVPHADRDTLSVEVRDFEPAQALFAGEDGLAIYRRLIPAAFAALASGGLLLLEIGYGQTEAVHGLMVDAGFAEINFTPDLQSIPRVASARRP